jgi:hypothetical protein
MSNQSRPSEPNDWLRQFGAIDIKVRDLGEAVRMRIDREARSRLEAEHAGLPMILRAATQVSAATMEAIKHLCYDRVQGFFPSPRLASAVAPLSRTFLESLFVILALRENTRSAVDDFFQSGLCKVVVERDRLVVEYGDKPEWQGHIQGLTDWIALHSEGNPEHRVLLSDEQKADPARAAKSWPTPGALVRRSMSPEIREFVQFLIDWYYDELSQDSHPSYMGFVRRATTLHDETPVAVAEDVRLRAFYRALTLYFALLAEVVDFAVLEQERARMRELWEYLHGNDAPQLWSRRYGRLLGAVLAT